MAQRDLDKMRQALHRRRRAILETTRREALELEGLRNAERDPEYVEEAQSEIAQSTLARLTDDQRREVSLIDAALHRLDAGEYGRCADCAQEIDSRRLDAVPYAPLCAECARRRERGAAPTAAPPAP